VSETVEPASPAPQIALRADHMVLDAALRGRKALLAVRSGRVEVFDFLAFVEGGRRLISSGNDARVAGLGGSGPF